VTDVVSRACRALAHPVRRALLRSLSAGECDVSGLCAGSDLDQPTVSKHLAALRHAGLVHVRIEGPRRCYSLAHAETVRPLLALLEQLEHREEGTQS